MQDDLRRLEEAMGQELEAEALKAGTTFADVTSIGGNTGGDFDGQNLDDFEPLGTDGDVDITNRARSTFPPLKSLAFH
jgi:hypothetical protein